MGTAKSSVSHTFNSNGHCGDDLARRSTPIRIARGLLGRDCNTHGHAINSRRDSFNFCRTHRRDCARCSGRSVPGKLFHRKSCGLRSCGIVLGLFCAAFRMEKSAYRYAMSAAPQLRVTPAPVTSFPPYRCHCDRCESYRSEPRHII
jgi:hypothetical protein